MRRAHREDIPTLLTLMDAFYTEAGYTLNHSLADEAFTALLGDERLGYIWLLESNGNAVGYLVLTLRFGMEYGGLLACLDDLFVLPENRRQGLSTAALRDLRTFCETQGLSALTVEVGHTNHPAQTLYRRLGMQEISDRKLFALPIKPPTHIT